MIDCKNDFKKAIGQPDKAFENSVRQALDTILTEENRTRSKSRRPIRYILAATACAAAATCALFIFGISGRQPDRIYSPDTMAQPESLSTPMPTPPPQPVAMPLPEDHSLFEQVFNFVNLISGVNGYQNSTNFNGCPECDIPLRYVRSPNGNV